MRYARTSQAGHGLARSFGCVRVCALVFVSLLSTLLPALAAHKTEADVVVPPNRRAASSAGARPVQKVDKAQPALPAGRRADLRHAQQSRHRPRQRRDLLQQLHPDRRPGHLRPGRQDADGGRQCAAQGAERQHRARPTSSTTTERLPRSLRAKPERRRQGRHAHRRAARGPPRRQRHRVRAGQVHAVQERPRQAAAMVHQRCAHRPRSAGRDDHLQDAQFELFGVPIFYMPYFSHADPSVKRRSGFLMPEYGQLLDARHHVRGALLLRAGAEL